MVGQMVGWLSGLVGLWGLPFKKGFSEKWFWGVLRFLSQQLGWRGRVLGVI